MLTEHGRVQANSVGTGRMGWIGRLRIKLNVYRPEWQQRSLLIETVYQIAIVYLLLRKIANGLHFRACLELRSRQFTPLKTVQGLWLNFFQRMKPTNRASGND